MFELKKRFMSKTVIKVVGLITAVTLSVSVLGGCGKKTANDKDDQGRTILTVGLWPDKEGTELTQIEERKTRFEENNPDVVIERDYWAFDRKTFYAKAAGGTLPTYFRAQFTEIEEMGRSEYSADLKNVMKKYDILDNINPAVLECVTYDDRVVAMPSKAAIMGLSYNVDLFEKAGLMEVDGTPKQPKDWNEVVEFAKQIKEKTGKPGIVLPTANRSGGWIFTSIAWSFGVNFMEQQADGKWKATFNTPEAAEALQWVKDLKWKYDLLPTNTLIDGQEWYRVFGTGNAGMSIMAGDYPSRVVTYGMQPEQVGIMATPAGPKAHVTLLTGEVHAVSSKATEDQIDAAMRWIKTETTYEASDEFKKNKEDSIKQDLEDGKLVGVKVFSPWKGDTPAVKYERELIDKYSNANPNHVRLYNEFVANCPIEIRPEEPMCCQELYATLDNCIQEVLTNKDADCASVLEKANSDFQQNYLNNL